MGNPYGCKPKPAALKKLDGTEKVTRRNKRPAKTVSGEVPAPGWLSDGGKRYFQEFSKTLNMMKVLTKQDCYALSMLAQEYSDYRELREVLKEKGFTFVQETKYGKRVYKRPEVDIANSKYKHCMKHLSDFGLLPSGREKVKTVDDSEHIDPMKEFFNE